ncbi:MAG: hypothetical protein MI723_11635 [Caulobacterales bacterium]|nr:hypothetical protein [Caulobacterales bacterium]
MMRTTTLRLLRTLTRSRTPISPEELGALYDDVTALDREGFVRAMHELRGLRPAACADVERSLGEAVDLERRKTGMKAGAFVPLLTERLVHETALDADALPSSARRSLSRFAEAAAAQVGEHAVLAAATAVARQRSFFYSAA